MKKIIFFLLVIINFALFGDFRYYPGSNKELKELIKDESVYLGDIDTSKIMDMSFLFCSDPYICDKYKVVFINRKNFEGIEKWNVSNVKKMNYMFAGTQEFNQSIGLWNVGKVEDMSGMFYNAKKFNQNINCWNVS
ncbi:BspA family leucine-rich repeat surface protein, partial [Fusobacterium sp. PH5-44]|uniref:BspA family leucine-rich repeat surface protein n=1 Tax=unclassified Fusobacterium TaxID=2648384 RepID=UPI003D2118C4